MISCVVGIILLERSNPQVLFYFPRKIEQDLGVRPILLPTFTYIGLLLSFIVLLAINVNEMGSHGVHFCIFYNVCIGLRMA
jgi:hypothetical protein